MIRYLFLLSAFGLFLSCSSEPKTKQVGERFFQAYSQMDDLEKILSYYGSDFNYENVLFGSKTDDPATLYKDFYRWGDSNFTYAQNRFVQVEEVDWSENSVTARGVTSSYTYKGKDIPGVRFVIWLEMDKDHKIIRQTDWYDYPIEELIEAYQLKKSLEIK